jgi:hypothetical protein
MKKGHGIKLSAIVCGIMILCALTSGQAFAWGSATHAYIDDHLGRKGPLRNLNEIYGGMAPDVFNFLFNNPAAPYLYAVTHYQGYPDDYLTVWDDSHTLLSKAVALGFVSHNGDFGADHTAHHASLALGGDKGYAIAKAAVLRGILKLEQLELGLSDDVIDELCHDLVEFALDIMITQRDKSLAAKISSAAMLRTPEFPILLAKAYADGLALQNYPGIDYPAAVKLILRSEKEFRKSMISYGQALGQEQEAAIDLIAHQLVDLAEAFLGGLPEGSEPMFLELAKNGLSISMQLCNPDFFIELDKTIEYVSHELASRGISD